MDERDPTPGFVSVVIPVRNGSGLIEQQLDALTRQSYDGAWQVIVADNGSDDGTPDVVLRWSEQLPGLRVVDASDRPGAPHARNVGAAAAQGDVLAFCDADDVVAERWLEGLVSAFTDGADLVGGPIDPTCLNDDRSRAWRPATARFALPVSGGFLPYAYGANLAVRSDVLREVGGFDIDFTLGDDVDLCWRAQLAGHRIAFAPGATVHYRYRGGLRALLRQFRAYGTIGPHLYAHHRDVGMPPSPLRPALRQWARLLLTLPLVAGSPDRRGDVLRRLAMRWGRVRGSLRHRVAYF